MGIIGEEEYEGEKILEKRVQKGGYTDNLVEAEKAIKVFEKDQEVKGLQAAKAQGQGNKRSYSKALSEGNAKGGKEPPSKAARVEAKEKARGFGRGLAAEKILGLRREDKNTVHFLIKWRGTEETDFVNSKEAKAKIPQVVIDFYESKLAWFTGEGEDSQEE